MQVKEKTEHWQIDTVKGLSHKVGLFDPEIGLSARTNMGPQNNTYLSAPVY